MKTVRDGETLLLTDTLEAIELAAELISDGFVVAFPTETVYGLGADALNPKAVERIFTAKERPADNPLIVHVNSKNALEHICSIDKKAEELMDAFWPGPLTLLLKKHSSVPDITTAHLDTVAVRVPAHPTALALLNACNRPIAAPSANRSGRPSPTKAEHVLADLQRRIPLIIDGGSCSVGVESTVVDMTADIPIILRPGGVTREMLLAHLSQVEVADRVLRELGVDENALSPGMRHRHYSPTAALTLVEGESSEVCSAMSLLYEKAELAGQNPCLMAFQEDLSLFSGKRVLNMGSAQRPEEVAACLFERLRMADQMGVSVIYCPVLPLDGIGLAVMNRLYRAAAFRSVSAADVSEG